MTAADGGYLNLRESISAAAKASRSPSGSDEKKN